MKKYILLAIVGLLLMSCFEDKGNYSYTVGEQITVSGVEKEYLRYFMNDRLVGRPEVCSTDPDARFEYLWTISAQGRLGDTLTLDKVLDTLVNWEPNQNYTLVLAVTNMNSGYTVYQEAELIVGTPYSRGWYVLKDDGQQTDIDLYSEQGKLSNILFAVNGQNLKGKAQKLSFIASHQVFDEEQNKYTAQKTLFALTDRDLLGIDISRAGINRTYENIFYEVPEHPRPQMMFETMMCSYFLNDGKVYSIFNMSDNSGKFGLPANLNGGYDYWLSKQAYCDYFNDLLVFDELSSSFYITSYYINSLLEVKDGPDTEMTCSRNNKRLLYMGNKDLYMGKTAYAVMEDLDRPDIRMISRLDLSNRSDYISISNDTILPTEKAFKAEMFTLSQTEEVLYFVAEGKLWARHIAGKHGQEKEQFTIPSGETVSFLKYLKYKEENIDYNYVVLGTQLGTQYKIRFFAKLSGGNIDPHPEVILPREGESASGHAGDVLYVSPKMYDNSYIHTF